MNGRLKSATQSATIAIASVCASLVNRQFEFNSVEEQLVIEAIRRSNNKLADASLEELGEHINGMNEKALMGFGNNVKGIYHELLYVHAENNNGDDITAELYEATNHPGVDVKILRNGEVIDEIQLKATERTEMVDRHFDRYPDIQVVATEEAASKMSNVDSSGFTDAELEAQVDTSFEKLEANNTVSHAEDVAVASGIIATATAVSDVLNGRKSVDRASEQALQDMGVSVTSSFLVDLMFFS